jgi:L-lactate dehydrogenase complex protein LldG
MELSAAQVLEGFDAEGKPKLRPPKRPITLRHLLTHTAGFSYDLWNKDIERYMKVANIPGVGTCKNEALKTPLIADPGDKWEYGINIDWAGKAVERFIDRVADYRATIERTTVDQLPNAIAARFESHGARRIATPAGVPDVWFAATAAERVSDDPPLSHEALDGLDGTITGCAAAIAETGTIVLDAGPDQGRRALSLLPDLHVCVVRVDQVVGTVPEALARLDPRRPQTWISGPSATSDIELQRVEGVHGPRRLAVILVDA